MTTQETIAEVHKDMELVRELLKKHARCALLIVDWKYEFTSGPHITVRFGSQVESLGLAAHASKYCAENAHDDRCERVLLTPCQPQNRFDGAGGA
jgi:hypothetical protein